MALERDDIQREIAETARKFMRAQWRPEELQQLGRAGEFPRALWQQATEMGWLDLLVPEAEGGLGLGTVEAGALVEEAGYGLFPGPLWETMVLRPLVRRHGLGLAPDAAVALGLMGEGRRPRLPRLTLAGEVLTCGQTVASHADVASVIVLLAWEGDSPALVAVEPSTSGLNIERLPSVDAIDRPCWISATGATVSAVLARGAEAEKLLEELKANACALVSAELLGISDRVLEMSVEYANQRVQFGRAIGSFQALQHEMADVAMRTHTMRSVCYLSQALLANGVGQESVKMGRIAKAYCSSGARKAVESALQVHGGIGFTAELVLHLYYKRALTLQAAWGDERYHERALGTALLQRNEIPVIA